MKALSQTPPTLSSDGLSRWGQIQPFVAVSRETWRQLVLKRKAPQPVKLGKGTTLYRNAEVLAWLADPVAYAVEVAA
jgi:predicted DNA-binding transcriptional regulator AlpA